MSNRSRQQRQSVRRATSWITPADKVRTVELYLHFANSNRVGDELGISGSAVRDRLYALRVPLRPVGITSVSASWQAEVLKRLTKLRAERDRNDHP